MEITYVPGVGDIEQVGEASNVRVRRSRLRSFRHGADAARLAYSGPGISAAPRPFWK